MLNDLTKRQSEILSTITNYIKNKGYAPSIREIGDMVNLSSTSTVAGHMEKLKEKGYVTWKPSQPRTLQLLDKAKTAS
ncbi:transcriptional regulator [Robertmurraya sp. DFI.2.37]|uniref:LexA family protein n=1 Tax=Robertmurraya sp. DFI.2.37 TaxID=3031819 RepID=UPI001243F83D|nr:transcriptional regulator [Robertmurraya sp. DFI.2.37]MDF1511357.1 transcriptional regulator [Robertmurraya sp. DFI.2.37]